MINVKEYSGHIRNWSALCERLGIDHSLSREDRRRTDSHQSVVETMGEINGRP